MTSLKAGMRADQVSALESQPAFKGFDARKSPCDASLSPDSQFVACRSFMHVSSSPTSLNNLITNFLNPDTQLTGHAIVDYNGIINNSTTTNKQKLTHELRAAPSRNDVTTMSMMSLPTRRSRILRPK